MAHNHKIGIRFPALPLNIKYLIINKRMEQEQILSNLKEGLGQTSLSERTISDFASVLEVPEDETLHGDFFSKQVKILKTVEGQLSHDVATKVEDFKKNFKPAEQPEQEPKKNEDEIPDYVKELREELASIKDKELEKQKSVQSEQLINSAYEDAKKSGAENEAVLKIVKRFVSVEDGDTPISLKNKIVAQYNETYQELYGEGAAPSFNSRGGSNSKKEDEDYMEHLRKTGKLPKK